MPVAAAVSSDGGQHWTNLSVLIADNQPNFQFFNDKESVTADPVKAGVAYGKTDEFGSKVVEDECHVHDFHATILHCLGFDHTKLTFRHAGRDYRLTDVAGRVIKEVLA